MADPIYGVEHSGNTPGAETLIVLNGPIIKQLGFNYQQGVLRDGFLPVGGLTFGTLRPALVLTPILAETIARAGWSKDDVKRYLFEHARMPAWRVASFTEKWADFPIASLEHQVNLGRLPPVFAESDDPNRLVPIVLDPDDFMVLVSGDPLRNNAYTFAHNGYLGFPTAKKISPPHNWDQRIMTRPKS